MKHTDRRMGDQERVMGLRGMLEEEVPPTIIPPPVIQTVQPPPMVSRALEEVDRGTT